MSRGHKFGDGLHEPNELVSKGHPCPDPACGSSDAGALYTDSRLHCFSCGADFRNYGVDGDNSQASDARQPLEKGSEAVQQAIQSSHLKAIASRKISIATCEKFDYRVRQLPSGDKQQLAVYRDAHGSIKGIKLRGEDKSFTWIGKGGDILFGRHLWGSGGKRVVITEGELDCLSVSQAQNNQWPVVSLPNGAQNAAKAIKANLPWLLTFDEVVWGGDMDAPGNDAYAAVAVLFPPGKLKRAKWDGKDPNEMLMAGKAEQIIKALWNAEPYRPDGIVDARQLTDQCLAPVVTGIPWCHDFLTDWTYGRRFGEVYLFGSGSGMGKSDNIAEVIAGDLSGTTKNGAEYQPQGWGLFAYESGAAETKKRIAGKIAQRRFHIPQDAGGSWTDEELRRVMEKMDQSMWGQGGKLFINDSKGAADWEFVKNHVRYLREAEGIRHFLVDPIGALVVDEDEERKFLDRMAREAALLAEEGMGCCIYLVSHLTRPSVGPSHEEGGQVRGSQFRGSNGLLMFSDFTFGMERDQQAETEQERCTVIWRSIKDRYTGNSIGKTSRLFYDVLSGTLDAINLGSADDPI